jgi:uncharacterized protein YkwD
LPRSVTRAALITGVPLIVLTTATIVGTLPRQHTQVKPAKPAPVAFFGRQDPAMIRFRLADNPLPTPTAVPAPAVPQPGPVAARPAPPAPRPAAAPVSGVGGAAGVEFSLVNQDRAGNGVASLAWSGSLARVAQYRAQDMLNRNYFSHYDPATGQLAFVELLHLWGIPYSTAGENIAWSTDPSMAAINVMFMNSPEHRANILNGAYHRMGVGVASNGVKTMVVEVFSN